MTISGRADTANIYSTIRSEIGRYDGLCVTDNGREISYQALFRDVDTLASVLKDCGIQPLSRVGFIAGDSYEYIAVSLAILSMNAAIIPLSTRAAKEELEAMPARVGVNCLIVTEEYKKDGDIPISTPQDFAFPIFIRTLKKEIENVPLPDGRIPAFIRFSSGTTGANKGVVLSHRAVIERTASCTALGVERGDNVFWVLDMAFHFVVTILMFLRKGAVTVICPKPIEQNMPPQFEKYPMHLLYATPYHYRLMMHSPAFTPAMLSHVKGAFSTAMKLEPADAVDFKKRFGIPLTQAYGIIEIGLPCVNRTDRPDKAASVGRIQPAYTVEIDSPDAEGRGDIMISGPGMFDAYLSPFKLRKDFCDGDFFRTGDIGCIDKEGYLFISGRSKNVIIFAGMKIFPYEVETILNSHPFVKESRVSPKDFPGYGEIPVAEIVPADSQLPVDWETDLRRFCYSKLAQYKVPKEFKIVSALPRTASGKLIRKK